jgi:hypothetical protein
LVHDRHKRKFLVTLHTFGFLQSFGFEFATGWLGEIFHSIFLGLLKFYFENFTNFFILAVNRKPQHLCLIADAQLKLLDKILIIQ